MKIKKAELSDLDYIIDSIHNLYLYENSINKNLRPEYVMENKFKEHIKEEITDDKYLIITLQEGNKNAGVLIGKITQKEGAWNYKLYSNINYLFVGNDFRRKGYAEELCKYFFNWAKEKGSDRVTLTGLIGNENAFNLYKKLGFEETIFHMGKDL